MIQTESIQAHNHHHLKLHQQQYDFLCDQLQSAGIQAGELVEKLRAFQVAIPSWALGTGGTRFGRFSIGGEPRTLEEKIDDVGLVHALSRSAAAISLHIPWDIPRDAEAICQRAAHWGLAFDAVNSNTFQDQPGQAHSYKFGSLSHCRQAVRQQAIEHNLAVIEYGKALGSKALTVWLADGSSFPGQHNFRKVLARTRDSLQQIYAQLPPDWQLLIEYKPYEPHFYSMVIPDWGTSLLLAEACGSRAFTLVDLGHHLPNTNIEQIVATLMMKGRLGGFHFNDSKYGDDDLSCGSIKPYQLFLIFQELVAGMQETANPAPAWMIDASHNLKDPLEDLLQSLEAIRMAYARALLVNQQELAAAQQENDLVQTQELLQAAFCTDVRPLLAQARLLSGGALAPLGLYRELQLRSRLIAERGRGTVATGL